MRLTVKVTIIESVSIFRSNIWLMGAGNSTKRGVSGVRRQELFQNFIEFGVELNGNIFREEVLVLLVLGNAAAAAEPSALGEQQGYDLTLGSPFHDAVVGNMNE
jgi:hypothetical protein